jgi:transposase InsO family protein
LAKAALLMRAGVYLAASTVERLRKRPRPKPTPPPPDNQPKTTGAAPSKPKRVVTAKGPGHLWHADITSIAIGPLGAGFWASWWPFSLVMRWALSWHIGLVVDHFSRAVVAFRVFRQEPTGKGICELLDRAVASAGRAPKYIVSDQGAQFQSEYRDWCHRNCVRPRFGAVGQHGSIAVIERCIETLKYEFLKRIFVPFALPQMQDALACWMLWYNEHRPHESLGNRTPAELRHGRIRQPERIEPRARMPLARQAPDSAELVARRSRGKLQLVVSYVGGYRQLPIVELREAA